MKIRFYRQWRSRLRTALFCAALSGSSGLLAAEEQASTRLAEMPLSNPEYLLQVFISLVVVLVAIFLLSLLLRKFDLTAPRAEGPIRVLHTVSLGGKEQLILVEVGEEQILVGRSPGQVAAIHMLEKPVSGVTGTGHASPAANLLSRMFSRQPS